MHNFPSFIYKSMVINHDHITSHHVCVWVLKCFVCAYTLTTSFYDCVSKDVRACVCVGLRTRSHESFPLGAHTATTHQPYVEEERESNPAVTHPSLFLLSCLNSNSNDQELPYCCGKARYIHTQNTHTYTHRGDFPVNPGKRGILTLQLLM